MGGENREKPRIGMAAAGSRFFARLPALSYTRDPQWLLATSARGAGTSGTIVGTAVRNTGLSNVAQADPPDDITPRK
jgi:hypothetical protein